MNFPFKKPQAPDFSLRTTQEAFLEQISDQKELLQKELDVNQAEQLLLQRRIQTMKELLNDLSTSDPHYSSLSNQMLMDQIELDELKSREVTIKQKIT